MAKNRKFIVFHLSLIEVREPTFDTPKVTRENWLRECLFNQIEFSHRGNSSLVWVPQPDIDDCIFGIVQRKKPHLHHLPPRQGGQETVSVEWQGAYVLLDPTHHENGQRIAVEIDEVGTPSALLGSLLTHLNSKNDRPYTIEAEPIFDGNNFWRFAERHSNVVRYIKFEFVVPNMWGAESALEKDLKDTGKETGAEKVKVQMEAQDGVSVKNKRIIDGVNYAEKGAGAITAKSIDGKRFSSKNKLRTTLIPKDGDSSEETRESIIKHKDKVLGND